eukprot:698513-Hanusia_phi.AAC.1
MIKSDGPARPTVTVLETVIAYPGGQLSWAVGHRRRWHVWHCGRRRAGAACAQWPGDGDPGWESERPRPGRLTAADDPGPRSAAAQAAH